MSAPHEIEGVVYAKPEPRRGKNGASFPVVVVQTDRGKYPQFVPFDCKPEVADGVSVGDEVTVSFYIGGREWTDSRTGEVKFFGSLRAVKMTVTEMAHPPQQAGGVAHVGGSDDDIPFATCSIESEPSGVARILR